MEKKYIKLGIIIIVILLIYGLIMYLAFGGQKKNNSSNNNNSQNNTSNNNPQEKKSIPSIYIVSFDSGLIVNDDDGWSIGTLDLLVDKKLNIYNDNKLIGNYNTVYSDSWRIYDDNNKRINLEGN